MKEFFFRKHSPVSMGTLNLEGPWAPHILFYGHSEMPSCRWKFCKNICKHVFLPLRGNIWNSSSMFLPWPWLGVGSGRVEFPLRLMCGRITWTTSRARFQVLPRSIHPKNYTKLLFSRSLLSFLQEREPKRREQFGGKTLEAETLNFPSDPIWNSMKR